MAKYVELGEIRQGDNGDYIKLTNYDKVEIIVNGVKVNGKNVYLNSIEDKYNGLAERGYLTKEQAEERISKTPDFVLEVLSLKLED